MANLSKTLHTNSYQNRSTFAEVMHKSILVCFYAPQCTAKTSEVIGTSGNLAAILDFWCTSTSHEIGSTTIRKLVPENIGVAV